MKKPALVLNLLWAAIAAGTFYAGVLWSGDRPSAAAAGASTVRVASAPAPLKPAGTGQTATIRAEAVSRDDDVLDFLKRYGLGSGTPLSAEVMTQAATEALRETNPIKSQMLFARLMEELTPENAQAALAMLKENTNGWESMRYMGMLTYAWGGVDPKAAMETLGKEDNREARMGQTSALTGWAAKDPQGAIAWLENYQGDNRGWLSQSLISGLAKSDFDGALKYATALEDEGDRRRASETLARELIRSGGVDGAKEWFASLGDASMKDGAFNTVADQLRRADPAKAAEFIKDHGNQEYARNAVAGLAGELSRKDVQQGLRFAEGLTGPNQARAYAEVVGQWLDRNEGAESVQASEFVTRMPPGESRDAASATIARRMSGEDPEAAIAWAGAIANPEQRQDTLIDVGRRYLRSDPDAAARWLATSGLSPEAQQQVTASREERGRRGGPGGGPGGGPPDGRRGGPGGWDGGGGRRGGR